MMAPSVNRVLVLGRVTDAGPKLTYQASGTPCATFTVILEEVGKNQVVYKLFVPVEVWGTHAEWVSEQVDAGAQVLIDGRLKWRKAVDAQGEKTGKLVVMAWQVSPVLQAAVSAN
jgi:single stranded DNA-binding protein